jgi:hypothetical protein
MQDDRIDGQKVRPTCLAAESEISEHLRLVRQTSCRSAPSADITLLAF